MPRPVLRKLSGYALVTIVGASGGALAELARLPMPYLVGSLVFTAAYSIAIGTVRNREIEYPEALRKVFMGVIGVMIGATFDQELIHTIPSLWKSLLAMLVFIVLIQWLGSWFYRTVGGYDAATAKYAAMPGGLVESVALGIEAGGDGGILGVQHFIRVCLIVIVVPLGISIWSGSLVGSAAGQEFSEVEGGFGDAAVILALAAVGMVGGKALRIPLPHFIGGLALSAAVHAAGVLETPSPPWLLETSQLFIGVGLGVMFSTVSLPMLVRAAKLGVVASVAGLAISMAFAGLLSLTVPIGFDSLFLSFTIGGVTEMGLIALSLGISPVAITVHHLFRIIVTVFYARLLSRIGRS
ncbi:MAG: AbrB family transcriptional regulator [Rhodobacteraceae bacterium]|nr:AbrB family transcriptional regulator [Paracoccaceae bacterium]